MLKFVGYGQILVA